MGKIGCLGDIPFEVSSNKIQTPKNMKWSGSARYATHQRHGGDALTEFVGNRLLKQLKGSKKHMDSQWMASVDL